MRGIEASSNNPRAGRSSCASRCPLAEKPNESGVFVEIKRRFLGAPTVTLLLHNGPLVPSSPVYTETPIERANREQLRGRLSRLWRADRPEGSASLCRDREPLKSELGKSGAPIKRSEMCGAEVAPGGKAAPEGVFSNDTAR
ncbi:hypothetical protein KM043_002911 [Ampulex compressa]|nr:hypothetical protein KM043_002911 [Ampulex compressa]